MNRAISLEVRTFALGVVLCVAAPQAWGQAEPAPIPGDVEESVAKALYARGVELFQKGQYADALQLFREAVTRSPQGETAPAARRMITRAEAKVRTGGRPDDLRGTVDEVETLDPYPEEGPLDPYPNAGADNDGLVVGDDGDRSGDRLREHVESGNARRNLILFGGAFGFWQGIALANVTDAGEGGVLVALGAMGLGFGGSYLAVRDRVLGHGQANAVMSGATWGSVHGMFLAWAARDLGDTPPTDTDGYWAGTLIGGLLGTGLGVGYAYTDPSAGDVAIVNSLCAYGTIGGLLVGGIMDPPYDGAYGMNAAIGGAAGIAGGLYLASRADISRSRMGIIDLAAGLGAASAWVLVYPAISDDDSGNDTNDDIQIASTLSLIAMGLGGGLGWYLTRHYDDRRLQRASALDLTPPGLVMRDDGGGWHLGSPGLRLAPAGSERKLAVDLLSGSF